jgi:hypothetical protein
MSVNAGIKKHGKGAEAVLVTEFAQLEQMEVYEAIDVQTFTKQQKRGHYVPSTSSRRRGAAFSKDTLWLMDTCNNICMTNHKQRHPQYPTTF